MKLLHVDSSILGQGAPVDEALNPTSPWAKTALEEFLAVNTVVVSTPMYNGAAGQTASAAT